MELDCRIKRGYRPLSCLNADEARNYVGKKCYFSNALENLYDLSKCSVDILKSYRDDVICDPFLGNHGDYQYCIPCEWIEASEQNELNKENEIKELKEKVERLERLVVKMNAQLQNLINKDELEIALRTNPYANCSSDYVYGVLNRKV